MTIYAGYTVLPAESNQRDGQIFGADRFERRMENPPGRLLLMNIGPNEWGHRHTFSMQWYMHTRTLIDEMLTFVETIAEGQKTPFWVSTKANDIALSDAGLFAGNTMDFWDDGLIELYDHGSHRRHFEITHIINPATSSYYATVWQGLMGLPTVPSTNKARTTFSSVPWGANHRGVVGRSRFSRLLLMRLADDRITIQWHGRNLAECSMELIEVPPSEYP